MAASCPKCRRRHEPVRALSWLWEFRDGKKPPGRQAMVLVALALRLDPVTGCGWTTSAVLAGDAQVTIRTVTAALAWGRDRLLVRQAQRGRKGAGSSWQLVSARPEYWQPVSTQAGQLPRDVVPIGTGSRERQSATLTTTATTSQDLDEPPF